MPNVVLPTDNTQNTFILSFDHSWTTLHLRNNRLYAPNKTEEGNIACYRLLPHTTLIILQRLSWWRSLCHTCELFSVQPEVESQWIVLVEYLNISTNVSCYQLVVDDNIIYLSATQFIHAPVHGARNTVQQLLYKTLNFLLSNDSNRPELNSVDYMI